MKEGIIERDKAIARAERHANSVNEGWIENALAFLADFVYQHETFRTEDVRKASVNIIPEPPDKRVWGAVMLKAKRIGIIRAKCIVHRNDKIAHNAFCSLWEGCFTIHDDVLF
jgi:hypothetical protein